MLNRCEIGDCRDVLRRMIADGVKVQMCVTSPPYYGLRDYGTATWEGGDGSECEHLMPRGGGTGASGLLDSCSQENVERKVEVRRQQYRHTCAKCGARRVDAQIGLEERMDCLGWATGWSCDVCYVCVMVGVFRLVREILSDDGCVFLNLGDAYASGGRGAYDTGAENKGNGKPPSARANSGLKPKDMCGIPWRVAFALQADGWTLRSDIIWHKPNPMPESVTDRPTKSHEYLFLLTKGPSYYYDSEGIKEPAVRAGAIPGGNNSRGVGEFGVAPHAPFNGPVPASRNRRTVWTIPSEAFADAHFATFPHKLVEPCILAGTSERGHCPECGKRWEREADVSYTRGSGSTGGRRREAMPNDSRSDRLPKLAKTTTTLGWRPTCTHNLNPVPDIVLDPFLGSGTAAEVAQHLGRSWIGIDLSASYTPMQQRRTAQTALALAS